MFTWNNTALLSQKSKNINLVGEINFIYYKKKVLLLSL